MTRYTIAINSVPFYSMIKIADRSPSIIDSMIKITLQNLGDSIFNDVENQENDPSISADLAILTLC